MNDYAVISSTWLAVASMAALRRLWAGLGKGQPCDALQGHTEAPNRYSRRDFQEYHKGRPMKKLLTPITRRNGCLP
jgi:hypothetical protein